MRNRKGARKTLLAGSEGSHTSPKVTVKPQPEHTDHMRESLQQLRNHALEHDKIAQELSLVESSEEQLTKEIDDLISSGDSDDEKLIGRITILRTKRDMIPSRSRILQGRLKEKHDAFAAHAAGIHKTLGAIPMSKRKEFQAMLAAALKPFCPQAIHPDALAKDLFQRFDLTPQLPDFWRYDPKASSPSVYAQQALEFWTSLQGQPLTHSSP